LVKAFGGDIMPSFYLGFCSRVPGSLNIKHGNKEDLSSVALNAFQIRFYVTQKEYNLLDFGSLPHLTMWDYIDIVAKQFWGNARSELETEQAKKVHERVVKAYSLGQGKPNFFCR
jgi:hypothetical protein